ncbi:MAG: hypothetical protein US13_C0004G0095 [candidate division TM6 bacterium GW2011_GWE2_36_25]|nr:MAG: hypothetical protein US03_C0004G0095 [candidate division TM6 bacterium GW2011_GWF2_36_131]KKQ03273.1 MAG: hypothetical protein US13_C0004G0095 [candidate division TM6 bacterium GW2011_GWE2_36_25]KKQ19195.1 MAG: hypothetical protein US32_C0014G0016 [candidate division TM6 bacterium GW2011_GWA2_36_9]
MNLTCRQVTWKLAGNIPIIIADINDTYSISETKDLLSQPFETHVAE